MKIVVIGTRGIPHIQGGVETHCEELYPHLVEKGCEVTVVRRSCYVDDNNRISEYKGVKLHDVYAPRKKSIEAIVHTFLAMCYARRVGADVVHCHAVGPSIVVPFGRLLGLKVVMTHHGPDYDRKKWNALAKGVIKLGERWGVTFANRVIVISNVINDIIKKEYYRMDGRLIYNGTPFPVKSTSTSALQKWGITPGKYIVALGRFVPEKGFDGLVEAYVQSSLAAQGIRLVIAGDADHEDEYSKRLKELARSNQVVLTGFIRGEQLNQLMANAALFVLPSFHEGLPISLLEAMSYELPVLVSDIPANKEVGLASADYFPCGDWALLADLLQAKAASPGSVQYDLSMYDWEYIAGQVYDVYKEVVQ